MLGRWLSNQDNNIRKMILVGSLHYVGLFRDVEMTLYLTKPSILHLCRLFSRELIGCAFGRKGDVPGGELDARGYCLGIGQS
jgi:hypothetical protein